MEKDFELKVRLNNILWSLGFYTRIEVKLAEYIVGKESPLELTDLDVLGIRITPELSSENILADCTTNKKIIKSPIQRIFWLKGVMALLGAKKAFLSLGSKNRIQEAPRRVGARLGITILDETSLEQMEKRIIVPYVPTLKVSQIDSWMYLENNLTTLPASLQELLEFRKHDYWLNKPHQNIQSILSLVRKHSKAFDKNSKFTRALLYDLATLLSLSIINMSEYVLRVNPEQPEQELRAYFYGGYEKVKRGEKLLDDIQKLLLKASIQENLFKDVLKLDPNYLNGLFDIAYRFLNKPNDSCQIPRYMQTVLFEDILFNSENKPGIEYLDRGFSDFTKKLTSDLIDFYIKATGIPTELLIQNS